MHTFIRLIFIASFVSINVNVAAQESKKSKRSQSKKTLTHLDSSVIKSPAPSSPKEIVIKYGIASFYHDKFNGRQTANGNTFNTLKYTAACNVLPLGIWVKVTNVKNEKSVIVYINDRLHHKNKRLIDLSRTAAKKLDFISKGITKVKVEVLGKLRPSKAR
jgi:rare lipoprotein A